MVVYALAINPLHGPNMSVDDIFANSIIVYPISRILHMMFMHATAVHNPAVSIKHQQNNYV